jgi:glycine hydroxymethyltransferase
MKIGDYIEKYETLRREGINLIASENVLSTGVKRALASDLGGRYHTEWYGGSSIAVEIIERTEELATKLFNAKHAIVNSLSGNICDLTVLFTFTKHGEKVAMLPFTAGGYPLGLGKFGRFRVDIPADPSTYEIDVDETINLLQNEIPGLVILGSSFILFPHPVREISDAVRDYGGHCVYDGAHILGLTACGEFQDPLGEGAEVLFGSTHKTLYGPQGGIILTNSDEHAESIRRFFEIDLVDGIGLVDNPHMNRIAALGVAMEEMLEDKEYGRNIVKNAKALAKSLDELGVPIKFRERSYTDSHQILLDITHEEALELCHKLEEVGIFIDTAGRIGVAEITHRGYAIEDVESIAQLLKDVYENGPNDKVRAQVRNITKR